MKTAKEIADALVSAPDLSEDLLEALDVYRAAKRQTGAPCALESALSRAAHDCIRHRDELRKYIVDAAKEAQSNVDITTKETPMWFTLDARKSADALTQRMRDARKHFNALAGVFGEIGDRIVATPEEGAKTAADRLERETAQRRAACGVGAPPRQRSATASAGAWHGRGAR